jgi:hypothetical protein
MKAFLREVVVVAQDVRQPLARYCLYGDTVGQAVFFVGAGFVKSQGVQERHAGLREHSPLQVFLGIAYRSRGLRSNGLLRYWKR